MSEILREAATRYLLASGWTGLDARDKSTADWLMAWTGVGYRGVCLATKDYQTEVGIRTAIAYLEFSPESTDYRLAGSYQSEGRNVLEPRAVLIPKALPEGDTLNRLLGQFVADAELAVDCSYARKLWLTRPLAA